MGENFQYQHQEFHRRRNSGGEIVEVNGGHIVRSIGRKDRHSKVCTSKGPRDRRVRLSANTAIQFYDVQDRLGYDRPSKAVDWLIKKAKTAIDELAELPPWQPTTSSTADGGNSSSILNFGQNPDHENTNNQMGNNQNPSILPPSLDSDSIADTIKSFFPMGASSTPANNNSPAMQFHQSEDLRLSLQSFKSEQGNNNMFLDGSGWPERMVGWSGSGSGNGDAVSGGFVFSSPPPPTTSFFQTLSSQTTNNHLYNNNFQRGPLQSSNTPSYRAWIDQPPFAAAAMTEFGSGVSGFSGFLVPARIQGEQEEHDGISDKPSSVSSDSRH